MKPLNENAKTIFACVKAAYDEGKMLTAKEIAEATGLGVKVVNGNLTRPLAANEIIERLEIEGQKDKVIKLINPDFDPDAVPDAE